VGEASGMLRLGLEDGLRGQGHVPEPLNRRETGADVVIGDVWPVEVSVHDIERFQCSMCTQMPREGVFHHHRRSHR